MKSLYVSLALGAALVLALCRVSALKSDCELLEATLSVRTLERDSALAVAESWRARALATDTAILGLREETTACLEREREAANATEEWRNVIAKAKSRDMAPEETRKVPDAVTRRALFDSLDRPL